MSFGIYTYIHVWEFQIFTDAFGVYIYIYTHQVDIEYLKNWDSHRNLVCVYIRFERYDIWSRLVLTIIIRKIITYRIQFNIKPVSSIPFWHGIRRQVLELDLVVLVLKNSIQYWGCTFDSILTWYAAKCFAIWFIFVILWQIIRCNLSQSLDSILMVFGKLFWDLIYLSHFPKYFDSMLILYPWLDFGMVFSDMFWNFIYLYHFYK